MCGIAGIISLDSAPINTKLLFDMTRLQAHRGPDDEGIWVNGTVGLGHRRLAIIDLSEAGHQPMTSLNGQFTITYNGEIYNYIELREELENLGQIFMSKSDTEVILKAYEVWGDCCVDKFIGMWAFAIWDNIKHRLFCSRDLFGIKPFFYLKEGNYIYFASDIKALLLAGNNVKEPDFEFMIKQLSHRRFSRKDETFYKKIRSLSQATNLIIENGGLKFQRYWNISLPEIRTKYDFDNPIQTFRELFMDAVRIHFRSDVPVGVCLSGGLDSSSIVAVGSSYLNAKFKTFSISYPNSQWSEDEYIDEINHMFHCDAVRSTPYGSLDYLDTLDRMVTSHGEPDQGVGVYSQWKVMELASGHVKVLLDGQGGDELLAGYPFFYPTFLGHLIRSGKWVKAFREYKAYRPYAHGNLRNDSIKKVFPTLVNIFHRMSRERRMQGFLEILHPEIKETLLLQRAKPNGGGLFDDLFGDDESHGYALEFEDPLSAHLYRTITEDLLQSLLYFEDRNSMAFSIESRVPFLDRRLVEFCLALTPEDRISDGLTKLILRNSLSDILPHKVRLRRDKKGFPTPLSLWLRGPLMEKVRGFLLDDKVRRRKILNVPIIEKKLNFHYTGVIDHTVDIFNWIVLELWFQRFQD